MAAVITFFAIVAGLDVESHGADPADHSGRAEQTGHLPEQGGPGPGTARPGPAEPIAAERSWLSPGAPPEPPEPR